MGVRFPYLARAVVEQGGGATAAGGERLWSEGKERGRREGPTPGRGSARGGPRWPSHDGRRQRAAGGAGPVPQSLVAVKGVGESTGELGGSISPAHLGLEWSGKVGPRKAGAAAEQACGGGAAWLGRELEAAEVAVGRRNGTGGPFIGRVRRWSGAGQVAG